MFKSLKQKIAAGQEGVSTGRQTPLRGGHLEKQSQSAPPQSRNIGGKTSIKNDSQAGTPVTTDKKGGKRNAPQDVLARVQQLLEAGKAQAENNGILDQQENSSGDLADPLGASNPHAEMTGKDESGLSHSKTTTPSSMPSTPKSKKALDFQLSSGHSTPGHEKSDVEFEADASGKVSSMSQDDLLRLFQRQEKTLNRYKTRFSEVVDAYKVTQKEKEKLENAMTSSQDKQLRRIKELKETIDLEQQAKRHMEEAMRLSLEEKDDKIKVLEEKIGILKTAGEVAQADEDQGKDSGSTVVSNEKVDELKKALEKQSKEIEKFKNQLKSAQDVIVRLEQEKKTAIQEIMENMQKLVADKNDLKAELILQKEENRGKSEMVQNLQKGQENMRKEIEKDLREKILEEAILRQEKEMQLIYQKKEDEMKVTFTEKIKEFQRVMEQKQDSLQSKDEEMEKLRSKISNLENDLKEFGEKDNTTKGRIQALIKERGDWEKKYYDANTKIAEEEAKMTELVQQQNRQLKMKQDEQQQQVQKVKRAGMNKINELQEVIKQNEVKIADIEASFSKDIESKQKEQESQKHVEISKATRKYETKINDMKKMIKELRNSLSDKEESLQNYELKIAELESKEKDSESIVAGFERRVDELTKELEDRSHEIDAKERKLQEVVEDSEMQIENARKEYEVNSEKQNEEVTQLKSGLASWEKELKEIEAKYKASEEELTELKNLNSNYKSHNKKLENTLKDTESRFKEAKSECDIWKARFEDSTQGKEQESKDLSLKYEEAAAEMREEFERSRNELTKSFENEHREMEQTFSMKISNLESSLDEATGRVESFECEKGRLEEELGKLREELEGERLESDKMKNGFQDEVTKTRSSLERLKLSSDENDKRMCDRIGEVENSLSESEAKFNDTSRRLEGKEKEIESLESRLRNAQEGVSENIKKMQDDLHQKDVQLREISRELENEKEERIRERKKWESEKMKDAVSVKKVIAEKNEMEEDRKSLEARLEETISELKKEVEMQRTDSLKASNDVKLWGKKYAGLENEVAQAREKNVEYENQLKAINDKYADELMNFEAKSKDLESRKENEIATLNEKIQAVEKELSESKKILEETRLQQAKTEKDFKIELEKKLDEARQKSSDEASVLENSLNSRDETHKIELEKSQRKCEQLEKKFKKIIADKEAKHKGFIENMKQTGEDHVKQLSVEYELKAAEANESFRGKGEELENAIAQLKCDKMHLEEKLENAEKKFIDSMSHWKEKENNTKRDAEESRVRLTKTIEDHNAKIVELEKEVLDSKAFADDLQMKVLSGESSSQELDAKFREIMEEKRGMEDKHVKKEQQLSETIKRNEEMFEEEKKLLKDEVSSKEEEMIEKSSEFEKRLELRLSDQLKDLGEQNKNKLLEMKKKAESKIGNLKKQHAAVVEQKDSKIAELISAIEELRASIENASTTNDKMAEEYETEWRERLDEVERNKMGEVLTLKKELSVMSEEVEKATSKVSHLEDRIERKTVEKMDALKRQKEELTEENEIKMEKVKKELNKAIQDTKRKFEAEIEDKEYEYTSRVKTVIKEFQAKLSDKDREHEEGLDETLDKMQREEQRVVSQYEDQVIELKRELKLRDDDMGDLKRDTNEKIKAVEGKMEEQRVAHEEEFMNLEAEYDRRIHEMTQRHEEELENVKMQGKESSENHQGSVNEIERKHLAKIEELEESHRKEKANIEKRLKTQMKKNQNEMKKLLAEKGALPGGKMSREGEDWELYNHLPNNNGHPENDHAEASDLKARVNMLSAELTAYRERERSLKTQLEASPRNGRPDTLNISGNLSTSLCSSPSTPEPVEYEYLKNILFQYMMGRQRVQMAKVLGAIVHFSPAQIKQVLENEEKIEATTGKSTSWF